MRRISARLWLPALLAAGTFSLPAAAQTLRGTVVDHGTGAPVPQVQVQVLDIHGNSVRGVLTDSAGAFQATLSTTGRYTLRAGRVGYRTVNTPPLDVLTTDDFEVEVRIAAGAVPLAPLTVTTRRAPLVADGTLMRRGYYTRQATYERLGARYLDRAYLDQRGAFHTSDLFREVPGMRATPGPNRTTLLTMRGGCTASIFVDGVHVNRVDVSQDPVSTAPRSIRDVRGASGRRRADPVSIDDLVIPSAIAAIEIYQSNQVPAEFQNFQARPCGAVVIWTGRELS
jgi:hypothetical protein